MELVNTILIAVIVSGTIGFIFQHALHALIVRAQLMSSRHTGCRVLVKQSFYDVNTGARFDSWRSVGGIRLAIASFILKV